MLEIIIITLIKKPKRKTRRTNQTSLLISTKFTFEGSQSRWVLALLNVCPIALSLLLSQPLSSLTDLNPFFLSIQAPSSFKDPAREPWQNGHFFGLHLRHLCLWILGKLIRLRPKWGVLSDPCMIFMVLTKHCSRGWCMTLLCGVLFMGLLLAIERLRWVGKITFWCY